MIDHTLLAPTATAGQVAMLCGEAIELGVAAVCVSPARLRIGGTCQGCSYFVDAIQAAKAGRRHLALL